MTDRKQRGCNFSLEEKNKLVKLIIFHKHSILNKRSDEAANLAKNIAWQSLTNAFNANGHVYRNQISLMRLWEKLKSNSKIYYNMSVRDKMVSEGPYAMKVDPLLKRVCNVLGHDYTEDITFPQTSNPKGKGKTTTNNMMPTTSTATVNQAEIPAQGFNGKSPWWCSGEQLPQPMATDRAEDPTNFCDCFQDIHKNRERIEEAKYQLLQEELRYKRKLYELRLKAAEKKVQINNAVLMQIHGRTTDLRNFFAVPHNHNK